LEIHLTGIFQFFYQPETQRDLQTIVKFFKTKQFFWYMKMPAILIDNESCNFYDFFRSDFTFSSRKKGKGLSMTEKRLFGGSLFSVV